MTTNKPNQAQESNLDVNVIDDTEKDEVVVPVQYEITSFGADYDVEGLVKRLQRDDIYIPSFQRSYVWSLREASRFIESLLLGLPVPGIFLARDTDSKRLLVIDGQQRLRTLQFFFEGFFDPDPESSSKRVFRLENVQKQFEDKTYKTLEEKDRIILNDSILHATIIKQDSPENDNTSIYHIFERLNTSGRKLSEQQIRVAIYHGQFMEILHELNNNSDWRAIFGNKSKTLKDQELILRFLAMYFYEETYTRPMREYLSKFVKKVRNLDEAFYMPYKSLFRNTIKLVHLAIGEKAFRPERALNAAVYDSTMIGLAKRLNKGDLTVLFEADKQRKLQGIRDLYQELLSDKEYQNYFSQSTSDENNVINRISKATEIFSKFSL